MCVLVHELSSSCLVASFAALRDARPIPARLVEAASTLSPPSRRSSQPTLATVCAPAAASFPSHRRGAPPHTQPVAALSPRRWDPPPCAVAGRRLVSPPRAHLAGVTRRAPASLRSDACKRVRPSITRTSHALEGKAVKSPPPRPPPPRCQPPPQPAAPPPSHGTPFCASSSAAPGAPRSSTPRSDSRSSARTL